MARARVGIAAVVLAVPIVGVAAMSATVAAAATCGGETATMTGTTGADTITGTPDRDVIVALGGKDTISGLAGNDQICGGRGVDTIDAGAGDDTVWGGGDGYAVYIEGDLIEGGPGDDALHGGEAPDESGGVQKNEDVVVYEDAPRGMTIDLRLPTVTGQGTDTIDGFYSVVATEQDDIISAGAETDVVRGLGGADTMKIDSNEGDVFGGDGNDVIRLGKFVHAGGGDDTVINARADVFGGPGDDVMLGRPHKDEFYGGDGNDVLRGRSGPDVLFGSGGRNRIVGGNGADHLRGGYDADRMLGGHGGDLLEPGDYTSRRRYADDVVRGGSGADTVSYPDVAGNGVRVDLPAGMATGAGSDRLRHIENAVGSYGDDVLIGGRGRNVLSGDLGDDVLRAGRGRDRLTPDDTENDFAATGDDILRGGPGSDLVSYRYARGGRGRVVADLAAGTATGQGSDTLASVERLEGTISGDQLLGDAGDNVLIGGSGDDVLNGRHGQDRAVGGTGTDSCAAEQATACEA